MSIQPFLTLLFSSGYRPTTILLYAPNVFKYLGDLIKLLILIDLK